ncbi:hypothetical protein [Alienimonas chondri]|uniref:PepSY domain-containing protein n=1 Tax=Alienimonas chondri TaxID=2681879 RepID=A0ABX1VBF4_9PLAN|nr:hypothetical protein [Alienimonas chondri]NNJ25434.1 hypothetical protein [Alienimonas chondri]
MPRAFGVLRNLARVCYVLATPAAVMLAGLGLAFAAAPPYDFAREDPRHLWSVWEGSNGRDSLNSISAERVLDTPWQCRRLRLFWSTEAGPAGSAEAFDWEPAPGLFLMRHGYGDRESSEYGDVLFAAVGGQWLVAWVVPLTVVWIVWAWKTGRFAVRDTDRPPVAWRGAVRPWVAGPAALGALCLAVPFDGFARDEDRFAAEVRRDPYVSWHPRALWIAWETDWFEPTTSSDQSPTAPLFGSRRWGVTAERSIAKPSFTNIWFYDDAVTQCRWTAAISLWWLAAPLALWSGGSLWRSSRVPTSAEATA